MRRLFLPAAMVLLSACATATGPEAADRFDRFDAAGSADFRGYEQVYLAPITASQAVLDRVDARVLGPTDRTRPIDLETIEDKAADLREDLERDLGRVSTLTDAPGPDVLTIAVTMTKLDANRPTMAEMRARPSLDFRSISIGGAAVDIVLSEDGRTLATIEDYSIRRNLNDPAIGVGIWTEVDNYFDRLANKLAALLS